MFDTTVEVLILVIIVAILGIAAGFVLGKSKGQQDARGANRQELEASRAETESVRVQINELNAQLAQSRGQINGLQEQLEFAKAQLSKAQQAEQIRIQHEREKAQQEEERKRQEQAKALTEQSKVLSALAPVQKNLDALQKKVTDIEEGRKHEMGELSVQLRGLSDQQMRLDKETSSLSAALRDNKVRGAWGEAQLRNIVESAGLLEHVDFDTQVKVVSPDGKDQRPDMVIHLPGNKTIPIDAKTPYNYYQQACQIPDTATPQELAMRDDLLKKHAGAVRDHVKTLGAKAYWNAFETAPDFVIAFIPNESLLQAALQTDPSLLDDAFAQKVALTTPVTLWAVLKSVAYAWQQQSLTEDAKQLFDLSRELYGRFATLGQHAIDLGKAIEKTVKEYNKFATTLESRVLVTARKLQKIDQSKVIDTVDVIDPEKSNVKELTAPETQLDNTGEDDATDGSRALRS